MKTNDLRSRRKFLGSLTTGVLATGLAFVPGTLRGETANKQFHFGLDSIIKDDDNLDETIRKVGRKVNPLSYDMSSSNPWGLIWSNVYYITNGQTGIKEKEIGLLNVFRHHGMVFGLNDATIKKYKLGEFFGLTDPITGKPTIRNPYYQPEEGVFPLPGLDGIKDLIRYNY